MNRVTRYEYHGEAYGFECPGCGRSHILPVTGERGWSFNRDLDRPTFSPSILNKGSRFPTDEETARIMAGEKIDIEKTICHSFVRDGKIEFLNDCTHALAGKTVDLCEVENG